MHDKTIYLSVVWLTKLSKINFCFFLNHVKKHLLNDLIFFFQRLDGITAHTSQDMYMCKGLEQKEI
jgi:hypothetical protein